MKSIEAYKQERIQRCELGIRGGVKDHVDTLNMWMTNQCNLHCVICPYVSKDTPNQTYYNKEPHMVTLKEFKRVLPKEKGGIFQRLRRQVQTEHMTFHFLKGETLLNPQVIDICSYIKRRYPDSTINILSNGTIPPKNPQIVRYIDILGFSLDGGTREVFEAIRTPAHFGHVVDTIRAWVRARNQYNPELLFRTSTTLSTMNFTDLPNIVRTVGEIVRQEGGEWDSIYCQPVVIEDYQDPSLRDITIEHVNKEEGKFALEETKRLAEEYHIRLDMPQVIWHMFLEDDEDGVVAVRDVQMGEMASEIFCDKLENGALSYDLDGNIGFACCFMDKKYWREIILRYHIPDKKSPDEIYNSEGYWRLRKDLLEGKLKKECRDCTIGKSNYYLICEKLRRMTD